jgi:uncharacterized membrane protein YgdD (TMEM256/DUF423 family)
MIIKIENPLLMFGALLGFTAIAMGAYAEHHLKFALEENVFHSISVALQYHLIHAVVIVALALTKLITPEFNGRRRLQWAGWLFVIGTILFCGAIYTTIIIGNNALVMAAPAGGMTLMAAWLVTLSAGVGFKKIGA